MRLKIAIIGAGITGVMTALTCARKGVNVDLYDAGAIPNTTNLSWAHGRLWKYIHENNFSLQPLAAQSQAFWEDFILASNGTFGCKTQSIRVVDDTTCERLERLYKKLNVTYDINDKAISAQSSLLHLPSSNVKFFVGYDAILLNARKIYAYLCHELAEYENVRIIPHSNIDLNSIYEGRYLHIAGEKKQYSAIICTINQPVDKQNALIDVRPLQQYQVHLDVHINDMRASILKPVLNMGDEHISWCVPSPDRKVLKLSASRFSYPERPDDIQIITCKNYLLGKLRMGYEKVNIYVSSYFELPELERQTISYWYRHLSTGCIAIEACDASIFKIAPALSEQISNYAIHGVK
ncbi:FAD-dependent oxidoreductase [Photorhabdus tasmaniensis]